MTEKRYFAHKHLFGENKVHDNICHNFMSLDETVEHLNNEYWKYKQLKKENEQLKQENKQLKHWNKCLAEKRHQEISYRPYTASKSDKELQEFLEQKVFNCRDR